MRMMHWWIIGFLASWTAGAACQPGVLVLLQDLSIANTHSRFFQQLKDAGYSLDIRAAEDKSLRLRDWDSWSYEKLILFASSIPGES